VLSTAQPSPVQQPFDDAHGPPWPAELQGASHWSAPEGSRCVGPPTARAAPSWWRSRARCGGGRPRDSTPRALARGAARRGRLRRRRSARGRGGAARAAGRAAGAAVPGTGIREPGLRTRGCRGRHALSGPCVRPSGACPGAPRPHRADGEVLVDGAAQSRKIGVRVIAGCAPDDRGRGRAGRIPRGLVSPARQHASRRAAASSASRGHSGDRPSRDGADRVGPGGRRRADSRRPPLALLSALPWPGNVEELAGVIASLLSGRAVGARARRGPACRDRRGVARFAATARACARRSASSSASTSPRYCGSTGGEWRGRPRAGDPAHEPVSQGAAAQHSARQGDEVA